MRADVYFFLTASQHTWPDDLSSCESRGRLSIVKPAIDGAADCGIILPAKVSSVLLTNSSACNLVNSPRHTLRSFPYCSSASALRRFNPGRRSVLSLSMTTTVLTSDAAVNGHREPTRSLGDGDRFYVRKLAQSQYPEFTPIAGLLDAPEGKAGIGRDHSVDKCLTRLDL